MRHNHLLEDFNQYDGALVFDDWAPFIEKCNQITHQIPIDEACLIVGIGKEYFHKVVDQAFSSWRQSPTSSILHGISHLTLGQVPKIDTPVFINLLWQTRFLTMCINVFRHIFLLGTRPIYKNDKPVMVNNTKALQADVRTITPANRILRCLYLYWWINSLKQVKLPKRIYRGIRAYNLYSHPDLEPLVSVIWKSDKSHNMKRKEVIDILVQWICERKLHKITDGNILSFTSAIPVAKYFSNGEGFILSVDPSKVAIISSELHDERLQGKDFESNKNEREYIVRIPENYKFVPEDIIINDLEYFIAEENPLSVSLFNHDDKEANYQLNGVDIRVWFYWKNNNSGSLLFMAKSPKHGREGTSWSYSRKEFTREFGFDPLPTNKNLSEIKNFTIRPHKKY